MPFVTCLNCKKDVKRQPKDIKRSKSGMHFCSHGCRASYMVGEKNPKHIPPVERDCLGCGKRIYVKPSRLATQFYCGYVCRGRCIRGEDSPVYVERVRGTCGECGKEVLVVPSRWRERMFCGEDCAAASHAKLMKGEANPNYIHGRAGTAYPKEFNDIREAVRDRDGRKCFLCGAREEDMDEKISVHHIDWDKYNNDMANLMTLCRPCHEKEAGSKRRRMWRAALLSFRLRKRYGYLSASTT